MASILIAASPLLQAIAERMLAGHDLTSAATVAQATRYLRRQVAARRCKGIPRRILVELERHAQGFGYRSIRFETGVRQPEAQRLCGSLSYRRIAAFGPYIGNPTSVCYERVIHAA